MSDDFSYSPCDDRVFVMGIGNLLLGDEGLGVHVIRKLENTLLPDNVSLLDAGTAFLDAGPHLEAIDKLIVIDAIKGGKKPGTVYRFQLNAETYTNGGSSLHDMSVIEMMKLAQNPLPATVTVLGIEPDVIEWSLNLSNTVEEALPLLLDAVRSEIWNAGPLYQLSNPVELQLMQ